MRKIRNNFRLYPFDTSLYGFTQREVAMNINLLTMTPLIGRLKEEGYECYFGYFHRQRTLPDGTRKYKDEDVGVYATNGNRQMIFCFNIGSQNDFESNLLRVPPMVEKYIVEGGKAQVEYSRYGIYRVGIEYLLGDAFDFSYKRTNLFR